MKRLLAFALALLSFAALSNGVPQAPPAASSAAYGGDASAAAHSSATASSGATSSASVGSSGASNGSVYGGDSRMYILPAPVGGSNLPAGMCQRSDYTHFAVGWNLISVATGQSHTDMECLELLGRLEAVRRTPIPRHEQAAAAPVIAAPPTTVCTKPKRAPKAKLAHGACR